MNSIDDLIEYFKGEFNRWKAKKDFLRMWSYEDALERAETLKENMEKANEQH